MPTWWAWHHSPPTSGLKCSDQRQPGGWTLRETVRPPIEISSSLTPPNSTTSSGASKLLGYSTGRSVRRHLPITQPPGAARCPSAIGHADVESPELSIDRLDDAAGVSEIRLQGRPADLPHAVLGTVAVPAHAVEMPHVIGVPPGSENRRRVAGRRLVSPQASLAHAEAGHQHVRVDRLACGVVQERVGTLGIGPGDERRRVEVALGFLELVARRGRVDLDALDPSIRQQRLEVWVHGPVRERRTRGSLRTWRTNPEREPRHSSSDRTTGLTSSPSRRPASAQPASTASGSASPTTSTSTSAGGGPTSPSYRLAHDPNT